MRLTSNIKRTPYIRHAVSESKDIHCVESELADLLIKELEQAAWQRDFNISLNFSHVVVSAARKGTFKYYLQNRYFLLSASRLFVLP